VKNIAVFASGRGSNFAAILADIQKGNIPAKIKCVISDQSHPQVFEKAKQSGIATHFVNIKQFKTSADYTNFLISLLDRYQIDLVILAGYLKLIPNPLVRKYKHAMINIHPALLPNFGGKGYYGRRVHEAVIKSGVKVTGVTVHFVDEHYDTGPIIHQQKVPVKLTDTPDSLAKRVLKVEHQVFPEVVKAFCEDRIMIKDNKVFINE